MMLVADFQKGNNLIMLDLLIFRREVTWSSLSCTDLPKGSYLIMLALLEYLDHITSANLPKWRNWIMLAVLIFRKGVIWSSLSSTNLPKGSNLITHLSETTGQNYSKLTWNSPLDNYSCLNDHDYGSLASWLVVSHQKLFSHLRSLEKLCTSNPHIL